MMFWIYDVPTTTLLVWTCLTFIGFSCVGAILVRPFLRTFLRSQPGINDLVGYILSAHGLFYGILMGLLSVAAYQNLSEVEKVVTQEAARLAALYRDASAYPDDVRQKLEDHLRNYCKYVIDEAWPQQQQGIVPKRGTKLMTDFQKDLFAFEPTTPKDEIIHAETLSQFNEYIQARRHRLHNVTTGIPSILWMVVVFGAIVTIVLVWLFDTRLMTQILLGGMLASFLGAVICLVAVMDHPFRGEVSISAEPFKMIYESLMTPSTGGTQGLGTVGETVAAGTTTP